MTIKAFNNPDHHFKPETFASESKVDLIPSSDSAPNQPSLTATLVFKAYLPHLGPPNRLIRPTKPQESRLRGVLFRVQLFTQDFLPHVMPVLISKTFLLYIPEVLNHFFPPDITFSFENIRILYLLCSF